MVMCTNFKAIGTMADFKVFFEILHKLSLTKAMLQILLVLETVLFPMSNKGMHTNFRHFGLMG